MKFLIIILICSIFLCSCGEDAKIIFPFEADLEKHYTELEKMTDGSAVPDSNYIDASVDSVLLEDELYSVGINGENGALWFFDKTENMYYDMTGSSFSSPEQANTALCIYEDGELFLEYSQGEFYDIVYEKYRPSLSAFYVDDDTVRLIYILGVEQLQYLLDYPVVMTETTYLENEFVFGNHYKKIDRANSADTFMTEYCTADTYYILLDESLPGGAVAMGQLSASDVRKELLYLGYDPEQAMICMFVADVSLKNGEITVDISPNRQYRTKKVRTSQYNVDFFENEPAFVNKTASESEKIAFAGSKFG